jgi:MFS family permease
VPRCKLVRDILNLGYAPPSTFPLLTALFNTVGAGTISDIWAPRERGRAMSLFYLGPLMGPLFAPIIGGGLSQALGWTATMWFLAIFGGIILIMLFFCLPETLARRTPLVLPEPAASTTDVRRSRSLTRIATASSAKKHTKKVAKIAKTFFVDPLQVLLLLRFPPVMITVAYASATFGALFVANISIQSSFSAPPYDYSQAIVGLLYLPSSLGYILSSSLGGKWIDRIMAREAKKAGRYDEKGNLIYLPEDRMRENIWIGGTIYPLSLILFGWTVQKGVFWFAPAVGLFIFGAGSMLVL